MIDRHDTNTLPLFDQLPLAIKPGIALPGQPAHLKPKLQRSHDMASIGDYTSGNYFAASDLKGKPRVVKIDDTSFVEFEDGGRKKVKPVISFEGFAKPLVLNKTNARAIKEILDLDETDDWAGERICIFPTMVSFGKDEVEAVRIKAVPEKVTKPKKATKPQADDDIEDEIPDFD